jgi:hypothetical protein
VAAPHSHKYKAGRKSSSLVTQLQKAACMQDQSKEMQKETGMAVYEVKALLAADWLAACRAALRCCPTLAQLGKGIPLYIAKGLQAALAAPGGGWLGSPSPHCSGDSRPACCSAAMLAARTASSEEGGWG